MTEKNDMIEEKNLTKLLRVNFTAKEKLDIGDQMANAIRNIKQAEDDLASVSSQYKSEIKKYNAELTGLAEKLNSGWEMRNVTCLLIQDFNLKSYVIKRLDTTEIVEERALSADELQMGLPGIAEEKGEATEDTPTQSPPKSESPPPDLPRDPFGLEGEEGAEDD